MASMMIPTRENTCAIVVTFNPDAGIVQRLVRIANQVSEVVIVDNHSVDATVTMIHELCATSGFHLISNNTNLGVAAALNQGMDWAVAREYPWVILFDQDTYVKPFFANQLQQVYRFIEPKDQIGIIGANFYDLFGKPFLANVAAQTNKHWVELHTVITSGSLLATRVFKACGDFRDDLFIDMVDTEYCLRIRSRGYKVYISSEVLMEHPIGNKSRHRFLWTQVNVSNQSALRKYYSTRNRLVLARNYLLQEPAVVLKELLDTIYALATILFYESDKINKYRAILIGLHDACRRRMGKRDWSDS